MSVRQKNKLAKVQILFTVRRGNQFYVDTQYLALTDAWSDKTQGMKSRYAYTDEFTAKMGTELTNNLASLRSSILNAMTEDAKHDMTKLKLERIIYRFHHPKSTLLVAKKQESLTEFIARYGDGQRAISRDVFLVGCYTAQRFSDYSTIDEGNIRKLENEQTVIDLKQRKTGNHVVIPVRPEATKHEHIPDMGEAVGDKLLLH